MERKDSKLKTIPVKIDKQSIEIGLSKVYILYKHEYESIEFTGVFSSKEQAEEIKKSLEKYTDDRYIIEEFELNRLTKDGTDEVLRVITNLKKKCGLEDTDD